MANQWNTRDILRLTRDCELGLEGEQLHVVETNGPYMTARHSGGLFVHTGRDYVFAAKIGEAAVDDELDKPLFSWAGDSLTECETRLHEVDRRLRGVPTAQVIAARISAVCHLIESIAEDLANTDHTGGG